MNGQINGKQRAALERLIHIANKDTGQSRRVASFLWRGGMPRSVAGSILPTSGVLMTRLPPTWLRCSFFWPDADPTLILSAIPGSSRLSCKLGVTVRPNPDSVQL
jgi:hypothetical protein